MLILACLVLLCVLLVIGVGGAAQLDEGGHGQGHQVAFRVQEPCLHVVGPAAAVQDLALDHEVLVAHRREVVHAHVGGG